MDDDETTTDEKPEVTIPYLTRGAKWGLTIAYALIVFVGAYGLWQVDKERSRATEQECVLRNEDRHAIRDWVDSTVERIEVSNAAAFPTQTEDQREAAQRNYESAKGFQESLTEALPILPCPEG